MKIKRFLLLICVLVFSISFTGCGESLFSMTPEEEAIITLYASKTVSKFNKNQTTGIANARVKAGELDEPTKPEAVKESPELQEEAEVEYDPETGEPITPTEESEQPVEEISPAEDTSYSLSSAINIEGVNFELDNFDVSTEYKASSTFILTKVKGKKYVVLNIRATNGSDKSVDFSKYKSNSYSLSINGGEKTSAQKTVLPNDLTIFDSTLAAGESKNFVLVFSCDSSSAENITSLALFVTSDDTTRGTKI